MYVLHISKVIKRIVVTNTVAVKLQLNLLERLLERLLYQVKTAKAVQEKLVLHTNSLA